MVTSNFKKIDILRKRRAANLLKEPFFIDTRKYIKKGIYIGLSIILLSILLGFVFIFRTSVIQRKKTNIKPLVDQYDSLQKKLDKESKELKIIAAFNKKLKNSIVNISSSSALLGEISTRIPKSIQLINLKSSNSVLTLKGKVEEDKAFNLINGFILGLDTSEFINFSDIDLGDIKIDNEDSDIKKSYLFDISTNITTDFEEINQKYLIKLGSEGLSNRINILKRIDK